MQPSDDNQYSALQSENMSQALFQQMLDKSNESLLVRIQEMFVPKLTDHDRKIDGLMQNEFLHRERLDKITTVVKDLDSYLHTEELFLDHLSAVQKGVTTRIFMRTQQGQPALADEQLRSFIGGIEGAGKIKVVKTDKGPLLKFLSEELRNIALPQLRRTARMQRINVKFVPALTPMQAQNKGFVYDSLKPILSLKLVEWGDRLRVLSTDEPATFKQTIDLSTRPSKIGAVVQTIIDQFGKVEQPVASAAAAEAVAADKNDMEVDAEYDSFAEEVARATRQPVRTVSPRTDPRRKGKAVYSSPTASARPSYAAQLAKPPEQRTSRSYAGPSTKLGDNPTEVIFEQPVTASA